MSPFKKNFFFEIDRCQRVLVPMVLMNHEVYHVFVADNSRFTVMKGRVSKRIRLIDFKFIGQYHPT